MNKFNVLVAGLFVFAAVAQLVMANGDELKNELGQHEKTDVKPKGGFRNFLSKNPVGRNILEDWGKDILGNGLSLFAKKRKGSCSQQLKEDRCRTCCSNLGNSFMMIGSKIWRKCVCYEKHNDYSRKI